MIDITTALYNILHSRYGKDVRQSIHDGISQINDNANEALQNAKTMGVGTAVTSSTSSSTGYVEGNLYLNNSTWDLWKCVGTNSWQNTGNIKGLTGAKGTDGINNFVYIKYSAHYDGTDFTSTPTASSQFIGIYYGQSTTAPTNKQDYQWTSYVGAPGTSAYIYIRYSENPDGSNLVDVPTPLTKYIGFYAGSSASAPAGKQYYTWSEYVGKSGSGSGDMLASEYAPSGIAGTVDLAVHADEADEATDATNASNLKKSNGETMSADDVTTKLAKLNDDGTIGSDNVKVGSNTLTNELANKIPYYGYAHIGTSNSTTRVNFTCKYEPNKLIGLARTTSEADSRLFNPIIVTMHTLVMVGEIVLSIYENGNHVMRLNYVADNTIGISCDNQDSGFYAIAFTM